MRFLYLKKVLFCVLMILFSLNSAGQEQQLFTDLTLGRTETNWKEPVKLDSNHVKIVYLGSSVPAGEGATNRHGYTSLFSDILKNRSTRSGHRWKTANISIGGDNTVRVLDRYNTDLLPQKGKYVIFALALGNEGIHEQGQPMFDQFETNIKLLIKKATTDGYTPIITNSYTRNDYNEKDYRFIKNINLAIHEWDVPSINLLGAVDDLSGHWVDGFWADGAHPNDAGHAEMAYTIVPSLFDALENKKPRPKQVKGSFIELSKKKAKSESIAFRPEHIVHPFTTTISFKTSGSGSLLKINVANGTGTVSINTDGQLVYSSPKSGIITGSRVVNDNQWHQIVLTHYYAKGVTMLYSDGALEGKIKERIATTKVTIGGAEIPKKIAYKNWLFYRSAMNHDEIESLAKGNLLQSSLELYAPLDGKKTSVSDPFVNLAQSMNTLTKTSHSLSKIPMEKPNPSHE